MAGKVTGWRGSLAGEVGGGLAGKLVVENDG
jgi:hypothetical protein